MKKSSSNVNMADPLDILSKIQVVIPPDNLREIILKKVENRKASIIPLTWVRSVAALALLILGAELVFAFNSTISSGGRTSNSIESIAPIVSNQIYYE